MHRKMGGKYKQKKILIEALEPYIWPEGRGEGRPSKQFVEPFFGAGWVTYHLKPRQVLANDANIHTQAMHQKLHNTCWRPESEFLTEDAYKRMRSEFKETGNVAGYDNAYIGFAGVAATFGGQMYASPAKDKIKTFEDYVAVTAKLLRKRHDELKNAGVNIDFRCGDYQLINANNAVVYCDPPCYGTHDYAFKFNHDEFWRYCQRMAINNHVFVTECTIPKWVDHKVIAEWPHKTTMDQKASKARTDHEKLIKVLPVHMDINHVLTKALKRFESPEDIMMWVTGDEALMQAEQIVQKVENQNEVPEWDRMFSAAVLAFAGWLSITGGNLPPVEATQAMYRITNALYQLTRYIVTINEEYEYRE